MGVANLPSVEVVFYRDARGKVPVLDWLREVSRRDGRALTKCVARVRWLALMGHEARRPEAEYLRDGIYELRARLGTVNYRILYFFHGSQACVLAHGLTKRAQVPDGDIETALMRKAEFERDPERHSHYGELTGND